MLVVVTVVDVVVVVVEVEVVVDVVVLVDVVVVIDVVVVVVEVEVEVDVVVVVDVLVVVDDVDVVVDVEVELEVDVVVPATDHQVLPSYLFHSFSTTSKYMSPSTGLEGCESSTFILPINLLNFVISFILLLFFLKLASPRHYWTCLS